MRVSNDITISYQQLGTSLDGQARCGQKALADLRNGGEPHGECKAKRESKINRKEKSVYAIFAGKPQNSNAHLLPG
jgi:hypothetical protein